MFMDYWDATEGYVMKRYDEILAEILGLMEKIADRVVDLQVGGLLLCDGAREDVAPQR
jgi:hypothetical protein